MEEVARRKMNIRGIKSATASSSILTMMLSEKREELFLPVDQKNNLPSMG